MTRRERVAVVVGTRPEAVKMAPVVAELRRRDDRFESLLVATGQHPALLRTALDVFGLAPDHDLGAAAVSDDLAASGAGLLNACNGFFATARPDVVLVQGDTASAMFAALAAFYRGIPVGHVEAGLRTGDPRSPFPEEAHRRAIASYARWSFCPTELARRHLIAEGVQESNVFVTGNTVVDAVQSIAARERLPLPGGEAGTVMEGHRTVLVTSHRRENLPDGLENICRAIGELARETPDLAFVFPVHLNPRVREVVAARIGAHERVVCCEPQPYDVFAGMLRACAFVLTDSGGLQEEAPSFGKRVVLCRDNTERPEGVAAGTTLLAGTRAEDIVARCRQALALPPLPPGTANPFGDGRAAARICGVLAGDRRAC